MSQRRALILVILILLVSFGLRIGYLAEAPGGFSQEELTGIRIIENIREGNIFVFFDDGEGTGVESLYYALSVTFTRFAGDGLMGYRMFSLWVSMLTLAIQYNVSRRLFGQNVALVSLTTMGVALWPTMVARNATHNSLIPFLIVAVLWAVTQAYYLRQRVYGRIAITFSFTLLGIILAVTAYAHATGFLAGIGVAIFAIQIGRRHPRLARDLWWNSGYALIMALLLGIPYIVSVARNLTISGPYLFWTERPESVIDFGKSIRDTVLAFFWSGDINPAHNLPGLPLTQLLEPVFLVLGLSIILRKRRNPKYLLVLIFFVLGLLPDMWVRGGSDFRLLTFAMPTLYMIIGLGIVEAVRIAGNQKTVPLRLQKFQSHPRWGEWPQPLVRLVIGVIVLAFAVNLYQARHRLIDEWPNRQDTQFAYNHNIAQIAQYLDKTEAITPTLICAKSFNDADLSNFNQDVSEIQMIEWMLHHENLPYRVADCRTDIVFVNGGIAPMDILFTDVTDLNVLSAPILAWFRQAQPQGSTINFNGEPILWKLAAKQNIQRRLATIGGLERTFYPRESSGEPEIVPLPVEFDGNMSFLGFDPWLPRDVYRPNDLLTITTYWQVDAALSPDVGIFVRLHDTPQASPYTEINKFSVDAETLEAGDIIVQVAFLTLPTQLRSHQYLLTLGLYEGLTLNQRQVYDAETQVPRGTYILIDTPFQVQAP